MIISVSRRTDIPAFYSEWFFNRLGKDVAVINPFDRNRANIINLNQKDVDCFVFWTKNARPLLDNIEKLDGFNYYFQYTVNCYGKEIEPNVPSKEDTINTFIELSNRIGNGKVVWRYDPIFLNEKFTIEWHLDNFRSIAEKFNGHTKKCTMSFIDIYPKIRTKVSKFGIREPTKNEMRVLAKGLSSICDNFGINISTCCESIDLSEYGIEHGKCIDDQLIREEFGIVVSDKLDAQRENCKCVKCHDIGAYESCLHNCVYCYAVNDVKKAHENSLLNKIDSKLMIGELDESVKLFPVKPDIGNKVSKFRF